MISTEDRWAIQDLVNRFCHYSDYGDWERLSALFTADCVTTLAGLGTAFRGPEQQVIHARHSFDQTEGRNRHYNHNLILDPLSTDEVWARYYVQQLVPARVYGESRIGATARMEDRLVRTAVGWRIAERLFLGDQRFALSDEEMRQYQ